MKKKWCRHIKWQPYSKPWWVLLGPIDLVVDRGFKFCPICGAKRPPRKP